MLDEPYFMQTSTKGISSIKSEMGILIIYSYSVIDVRTWWFGWVQEIQEAIFKREHSSSILQSLEEILFI